MPSATEVKLERVRLAFCDGLWEAKAGPDGGRPAFSVAVLFGRDHPDAKKLSPAILAAAQAKWADKAVEMVKALKAADRLCLHDGDTKPDYQGYPGNLFINARTFSAPMVVDKVFKVEMVNGVPKVVKGALSQKDGRPYSGCVANVLIDLWAQSHPKGGKRINANLKIVQFVEDGEPFGGARPPTADQLAQFGDLSGEGLGDIDELPEVDLLGV